ncbi:hypothetical protein E2C01_070036 [Portunus trituberculatus]|uniref:Uncharacterized protein n=1 Tax=Portunus trituberculatus TaxID=210409 RepID=A0A5B7I4D7_PORTR|nr:hypothetical protein [Portunus trituberculatus]
MAPAEAVPRSESGLDLHPPGVLGRLVAKDRLDRLDLKQDLEAKARATIGCMHGVARGASSSGGRRLPGLLVLVPHKPGRDARTAHWNNGVLYSAVSSSNPSAAAPAVFPLGISESLRI